MSGVTDDQPPQDSAESEQAQPIVAMRDLSAGPEGAGPAGAAPVGGGVDPAYQVLPLSDSRQRSAGGLFLLLSAVSVAAALLLPLYDIVSQPSFAERNGDGGLLSDVTFQVTPWGLTRPPGFGASDFGVLQLVIGPAPLWGIPLAVIALLLVVSGGALVLRRQAWWTMPAVIGSVALFAGCVVAIGTFLFTAAQGYPVQAFTFAGAGVSEELGPSFWVLIFALLLALVGMCLAAFLGYRDSSGDSSGHAVRPVERDEPDTPALGFPMPGLDQGTTGD